MTSSTTSPSPRWGEIWRVDFNPAKGAEIQKKRPAIVVSSDAVGILPLKLVVPITEWRGEFSRNIWHVRIDPDPYNGLSKVSAADVLHLRSVGIGRFIAKLGYLQAPLMEEVTTAIAIITEYC